MRISITLAAILMAISANAQMTWYVSTNGNDTATGTSWAAAFQTIQKAVSVAVSNDTISVTNGV